MTADNHLAHRIVTPDGVHRPACSDVCASLWLSANPTMYDAVHVTDPVYPTSSCASCSWCGELACWVVECRYHQPDSCPDFDPLASYHVQRAVQMLTEKAGKPLSPRCWDLLTKHATALWELGRLSARPLVDHVWDQRIGWV